jgi:hypothetical protein
MSRQLFTLKLSITLEAPYLIHGNDPGRFGLDATLLKDHQGNPVLPGTLVAGRIAEVWQSIGNQLDNADADKWFGHGGVANDGQRARLLISDLPLEQNLEPKFEIIQTEISRIRQNDDTGAVEPGHMLIIEQISKPGTLLPFSGEWRVWATDEEIKILVPQLRAALMLQTQLGAYRGVGFGRVRATSVEATATKEDVTVSKAFKAQNTKKTHQQFSLCSNVPLCVGSQSRRGNVFESDSVISGGTILGAIAQMLIQRAGKDSLHDVATVLARNFDQLRCTHALLAKKGGRRPMPLPQSLVSFKIDKEIEIKDTYQCKNPPAKLSALPAFQTDWKSEIFEMAAKNQGCGDTKKYLRVRTDIDNKGKAKDESLFAYQSVVAEKESEWLFDLDLSHVAENVRAEIWQELAGLLSYGLFPIGKTDAYVSVEPVERGKVWESKLDNIKQGDLISVTLISDALLFPTSAVADQVNADLAAIYKNAFANLHDGALEYSHHFATQRLAGGNYHHKRYMAGKDYQPWILTESGSVFVFKTEDQMKAVELLKSWLQNGLPIPTAVKDAYGDTWQTQPFIPQNGYGEVTVNAQHPFSLLACDLEKN